MTQEHAAESAPSISPDDYDAVIFDLDGVVTDTAQVHAKAWKRMFDGYLREWSERTGEEFEEFDIDTDYRRYVDGMARCDGAERFLESRGIELPRGDHDDTPDMDTVCGVAARKNEAFVESLNEDGVEAYETTIDLIRDLRNAGIATAIISASKNCAAVLDAAGVSGLYVARVDGFVALELDLPGKPDPAVFVEAARRVEASIERSVVVEDALAGVEAGKAGGFGLVIGVDRVGHAEDLAEHGADVVVRDLGQVTVDADETVRDVRLIRDLPSALGHVDDIVAEAGEDRLAFFLDYDGTLTPIVERPEDAVMPPDTREVVRRLARVAPVAAVSGRDVSFVREQVDLDEVVYAGSHGFDIVGPEGFAAGSDPGARFRDYLPALDSAEEEVRERLASVEGANVERKKYSVAVHYRQVTPEDVPLVEEAVDEAIRARPRLKNAVGKKVFEMRPAVDWHKGKAVRLLEEAFGADGRVMPLYVGDDLTDEDAFAELEGRGVGVAVGAESRPTKAGYALTDTGEVAEFLSRMAEAIADRAPAGGGR
jgi:trehalose 6-phosphate phosphatase